MKLGFVLVIGSVWACSAGRYDETLVEATSAAEGCDPNAMEELPPGYARIDGCPGSSPAAVAAVWAEYCAVDPEHARCSASCGDAGRCPAPE